MSEVMLHGVLNMPPDLWAGPESPLFEIDKKQRHSRYVEASQLILSLQDSLRTAEQERDQYKAALDGEQNLAKEQNIEVFYLRSEIECLRAQLKAALDVKLDKPARVNNTVFREGVSARLVVDAAQRYYEFMYTVK